MELLPEEVQTLERLQKMGLKANPIQTLNDHVPDFSVEGDNRGYLVEVKSRQDSEKWEEDISHGISSSSSRSFSSNSWLNKKFDDAMKKFSTEDPQHQKWWMLWISIDCNVSPQAMFEQAINAHFGIHRIIDTSSGKKFKCINFAPGVFEKFPDIVATVIKLDEYYTLCVNELSADFKSFTSSIIWKTYKQNTHPLTESYLKGLKEYLFIDSTVKKFRKDKTIIAKYFKDQYEISEFQ